MSDHFVIDASVAVAWVHPAQATPETETLLNAVADGAVLEAPALWPLEVANALLVLARRGKLSDSERTTALGWLVRLAVKIDHEMSALAFTKISSLAVEHQLSVYDAAYLELARRLRVPLLTYDAALLHAAKLADIKTSI